MTMDGHATNICMCTQLGCDLKADPCKPLKTHFQHPVTHDNVFVMMDACHMLKLTRNMLQVHAHYCPFSLTVLLFIHLDFIYIILQNMVLYS